MKIKEHCNIDPENLFKRNLEVLRNSFFARHGYTSQNRKMRYFFDNSIV